MHLIITKDMFFYYGLSHLIGTEKTVLIQIGDDIISDKHHNSIVIVDTLKNNIFYTDIVDRLREIRPRYIFILSPFGIKNIFRGCNVAFICRNSIVYETIKKITSKEIHPSYPEVYLTCKQHQVLSFMFRQCDKIKKETLRKLPFKTFYTHKYNAMNLLEVKNLNELRGHPFIDYIMNI